MHEGVGALGRGIRSVRSMAHGRSGALTKIKRQACGIEVMAHQCGEPWRILQFEDNTLSHSMGMNAWYIENRKRPAFYILSNSF